MKKLVAALAAVVACLSIAAGSASAGIVIEQGYPCYSYQAGERAYAWQAGVYTSFLCEFVGRDSSYTGYAWVPG